MRERYLISTSSLLGHTLAESWLHPWSCRGDKAKLVPSSGEASLYVCIWKWVMWPGNRQPLQGSPSMMPLRSLLHPLLGRLCCEGDDIWRQQEALILWLLTSLTLVPSVKSSLNKRVATSKSPSGEKYTIRNRRGQACSNSLLLRMRVLGSNTLEEKADGKYCSLLQ